MRVTSHRSEDGLGSHANHDRGVNFLLGGHDYLEVWREVGPRRHGDVVEQLNFLAIAERRSSTPAMANGVMYLRTLSHVMAVGPRPKP